jgi:DNA polymerase family A/HNH endonuclease/intein-like protein with splicing domain
MASLIRQYPEDGVIPMILKGRVLQKAESGFSDEHVSLDHRMHPTFSFHPNTGRLCLAKGTRIETVRDVSKYPKGVPIEQVQAGDLVYSYTMLGGLTLKKVTWVGQTGVKPIVRVHWQGSGHQHTGSLDCTENHEVLLTSGEYKSAVDLRPGDRVYAFSRAVSNYGYARLYPTGLPEVAKEHRFIFEKVHGWLPEHVHHKDGNKLNNQLDNLEPLTASEHTSQHAKGVPGWKRSVAAKKAWASRKTPLGKSGKDHPGYLGLDKEWMIEVLRESGGRPTVFKTKYKLDYETVQKYMREYGIDWRTFRPSKGQPSLGGNHEVLKVEVLNRLSEVYDIEVEGTHNFIAEELCVHNSSRRPNLQNVSQERGTLGIKEIDDVKIEVAKAIRNTIIAPEGFLLVEADWKAIEAVLVGFFAEDETYIRAAKLGVHDILGSAVLHHQGVWEKAIDINKDSPEEVKRLVKAFKGGWLTLRNVMKTVVHGAGYGRTVYAIAKALRISQAEAQLYMDIYHKLAPKVVRWQEATRVRAHKEGFLENPFGYRRYFWDVLRPANDAYGNPAFDKNGDLIMSPDGDEANEALAFLPQSTAAGLMREALLTFDKLQDENFYPVVTVHDSVLFEVRITHLKHYLGVIREVMEAPCPQLGGLSIEVEAKMGPEWSSMEEVKWNG